MIRKIEKKDIKRVEELENSVFGHSLSEEMFNQALTNSFAYFYVYEEDKIIKAYVSIFFDGYTAEILNFCVDKEYQHQGIGSRLLTYVLDLLKEKGAKNSVLEVRESNNNAIACYQKLGYQKISIRKEYYDNLENAIVMNLDL